jgi:uncharacterized paraquat-inducible protein A
MADFTLQLRMKKQRACVRYHSCGEPLACLIEVQRLASFWSVGGQRVAKCPRCHHRLKPNDLFKISSQLSERELNPAVNQDGQ